MHDDQLVNAKLGDNNKELWVAIMEKAFAKLHGSYGAIEGGKPALSMEMLTGQRSEVQFTKDVTLQQLDEWLKNKRAVILSSRDDGTDLAGNEISTAHAYFLKYVDLEANQFSVVDIRGNEQSLHDLNFSALKEEFRRVSVNPVTGDPKAPGK
jgi:hypothetical protein